MQGFVRDRASAPAGVLLLALLGVACGSDESAESAEGGPGASAESCASNLPRVQQFDAQRAARGEALLTAGTLAAGVLPEAAVRLLWMVWGTPEPKGDADFWAQARARYGML